MGEFNAPDIWGENKKSFLLDKETKRSRYLRPLVPVIPVRPTHGTNILVQDSYSKVKENERKGFRGMYGDVDYKDKDYRDKDVYI